MNYKDFEFTSDRYIILSYEERYTRTTSGKSWKSKPDSTSRSVKTAENYKNYITAIPFFNRLGSCRAIWTYTYAGYLPTRITSTSPDGKDKIVRRFRFIPVSQILEKAGWREKNVIENAIEWETVEAPSRGEIITFITKENSAEYEVRTHKWVG